MEPAVVADIMNGFDSFIKVVGHSFLVSKCIQ